MAMARRPLPDPLIGAAAPDEAAAAELLDLEVVAPATVPEAVVEAAATALEEDGFCLMPCVSNVFQVS
jgi:hypothetical protein